MTVGAAVGVAVGAAVGAVVGVAVGVAVIVGVGVAFVESQVSENILMQRFALFFSLLDHVV